MCTDRGEAVVQPSGQVLLVPLQLSCGRCRAGHYGRLHTRGELRNHLLHSVRSSLRQIGQRRLHCGGKRRKQRVRQ